MKMTRRTKINLAFFCFLSVVLASLSVVFDFDFIENSSKPWHMQPITDEDSLSNVYKNRYELVGRERISNVYGDSIKRNVYIIIDAWGVPYNPQKLEDEFQIFEGISTKKLIHKRLLNQTRHAEKTELRLRKNEGIYLFGGDSLEYGRKEYILSLGFQKMLFCQFCKDDVILDKVIALLDSSEHRVIAATTQSSRDGDGQSTKDLLEKIAKLIKKYPDVKFVVQGSHRPILGSPMVRKEYYPHWVPVLIGN